jgi:orotate phosphoribosyltransferase
MEDRIEDLQLELCHLIALQSIRRGDFTLASGLRSRYYCDTKATTLSPRGARLSGEILFRLLQARQVEAVGGLAMGAAFIATAVSIVSDEHGFPIYGFTVREQKKGHGLEKVVEESFHPDGRPLLSPGRRVAVVDDVVTKGGSILKAIETVQELGCTVVTVAAIVDRRAGGGDLLRSQPLPYFALFETDETGNLHVNDIRQLAADPQSARAGATSG